MGLTARTLYLASALRAQLEGITDRQARDIVAGYARGWDDVAGELDAALQELAAAAKAGRITRTMVARSARLTRALSFIAERLTALADDTGVLVVGDLAAVVRQAGEAQAQLIGAQLPSSTYAQGLVAGWERVDEAAIDAMVRRTTEQVTSLTRPLSREATAAMRRELIRGVTVGANPRETASRMLARTQGLFEGGSTRALTIARTETLDAYRTAAALAQKADADVLTGWLWLADIGPRTCPACLAMHGSVHPVDEPGPLGHQNCRCTRLPLTKSWRDLGLDVDEPPAVDVPDAGAYFDSLDAAEQRRTLGPGRYEAWKAGDFPMDRWATRRSTDGWRDSYVPTSLADAS